MVNDIKAIVWKEWKEFYYQLTIRSVISILVAVAIIGVLLPIKKGAGWFDMLIFYTVAIIGPFLMITTLICDLFAGERERRTLETLLASRLSDKGIVLGKVVFAICYSMCITLVLVLINIVAVNIEYYKGAFLIFSARTILIVLVINFSLALFGSLIGAIVSIRASSVKQAQLILTASIIFIGYSVSFLITNYLPGSAMSFFVRTYLQLGSGLVCVIIGLIILMINLLILQYVFSCYKRFKIFS